jgi:hypothetical protein
MLYRAAAAFAVQAVGLIISGIITATAAHMTEKARQRNISFAGQSMAAIGAAMSAAAIQQPPHQFASDACCSNGSSSSGGALEGGAMPSAAAGSGSFKKSGHARGMSVSWDTAAAAGGGSGRSSGLAVRIDEAGAEVSVLPGADFAAHSRSGLDSPGAVHMDASGNWLSGGGSAGSPDCPANSLSGAKAAAAAAGGSFGNSADCEVRWLMDGLEGEGAQQAAKCYNKGSSSSSTSSMAGGLSEAPDVAAEAQMVLAELQSEASIGRASFGRQMLGQQGSAVSVVPAGSSYGGWDGRDAGDADGLDLDGEEGPGSSSSSCAEALFAEAHHGQLQSQPGSMPGSPKRASAAAGFGGSSNGRQQQQAPALPTGRASLAVSRSSSRRGSVAADAGGGVYSVLSELDLSQNPLGATGAKVVAEVWPAEHWKFLAVSNVPAAACRRPMFTTLHNTSN